MAKMTDEIAQKCMELHSYTQLPNCEGCPLDGLVEKDYCYEDAFELWYSNVLRKKSRGINNDSNRSNSGIHLSC